MSAAAGGADDRSPGSLPIDRRIVVIGTSMAVVLGPDGPMRPGHGPPYPVVLERQLRAAGVWATCTCRSRARLLWSDVLRTFDHDVLQLAPEVVVLNLGGYEAFSGAVPQLLRRYLYVDLPRQGGVTLAWRRAVAKPLRSLSVRVQRVHGRVLGPRAGRHSLARVEREIRLLLDTLQRLGADPYVVLLGTTSFDTRVAWAMPGLDQRVAQLNALYERLASERGGEVEFVDIERELGERPWRSFDGMHFDDAGHRAVGEILAERIRPRLEARTVR